MTKTFTKSSTPKAIMVKKVDNSLLRSNCPFIRSQSIYLHRLLLAKQFFSCCLLAVYPSSAYNLFVWHVERTQSAEAETAVDLHVYFFKVCWIISLHHSFDHFSTCILLRRIRLRLLKRKQEAFEVLNVRGHSRFNRPSVNWTKSELCYKDIKLSLQYLAKQ